MIGTFVTAWGYPAVFLGTLLEGETILLAAGFAAHRGLLDWRWVMLVAVIGATLGDQLAFLLGRWKGAALISRIPALACHAPRAYALLQRHHVGFILANRFLYGLRIAGPIVIGMSGIPLARFSLLNLIGAVLWAAVITASGYAFGAALESWIADIERIEEIALLGILAAGFGLWLWRRRRLACAAKAGFDREHSRPKPPSQ